MSFASLRLRYDVAQVVQDPVAGSSIDRLRRGGQILELLHRADRFDDVERVVETLDRRALEGIALQAVATFKQQALGHEAFGGFWEPVSD